MSKNESDQSVKYAVLHTPLFLAGTNLSEKLDPSKRRGLDLVFDDQKKRLVVGWQGEVAMVPEPNVAFWIEGDAQPEPAKPAVVKPFSAQVSTPQDHVFAGPGGGKARDAK